MRFAFDILFALVRHLDEAGGRGVWFEGGGEWGVVEIVWGGVEGNG